ncbi:MAG: DUF547 domain-containing protein [Parafilimonas sp.]
MKNLFVILISVCVMSSCYSTPQGNSPHPPGNEIWNNLLHKYVTNQGLVNYKGFISEKASFDSYLKSLSDNPPSSTWSTKEKEAYWINVYNAFTVKLIIDHYPVKSIKDIGPAIQIPFVNTPWEKEFFKIGGENMKLDAVEHDKLRKGFGDPRVHFAIVCASISCPKLRNEAYEGSTLDAQLDDQAKAFLSTKSKNVITADKLQLSKIFSWYKGDFTKNGSLIDYLNKYAPVKINKDADIDYLDYNWNLNQQ